MNKILVVEDESSVSEPLINYLEKENFRVSHAKTLREARVHLKDHYDLVLLDWMLPDGQGIELLREAKGTKDGPSFILLTAKADLIDKVVGLELGANDYLAKPFEPRELVARMRVQCRMKETIHTQKHNVSASQQHKLESSGIYINFDTHEATYLNKSIELTKTEFDLLKLFLENPNKVFSRDEILKQVWGYDQFPTTRTVDTHVLQLRQKTSPELFETLHRIGYRFKATEK